MSAEASNSVTELARHAAHLSSVEEQDPPYLISGIAIGEGDVTLGQSGVKKKWPREALKPAAESLQGRPLVVDHENGSYGVVGEVTRVEYRDDVGVLYEAELDDEELAEKVENGRLEVSIRGFHGDVEEMQEDAETGAKLVRKMRFDNLSVVPSGAAPSNTATIGGMEGAPMAEASEAPTVEAGPSVDLSAAECAEMLNLEEEEEEAGDRPEGAEKEEDSSKFDESPERYPEGDNTPEEAGEQEDLADGSTDENSPSHDDADTDSLTDEEEQSRGAGTDEEPESILSDVTFVNTTMTQEELEDYDDPHVVEGDTLDELREQADKVSDLEERVEELAEEDSEDEADEQNAAVEDLREQFEDDLSELKERTSVLDEVDRSQVDELAEHDDPMVIEAGEFEDLQESVSTVTDIYAESLSEHVGLSAEKLAEKMTLDELREELEEQIEEDSVEEELNPAPKGEDVDEEELEEAAAEEHEETEEELSEDVEAEQERLRNNILN